MIFNVVSARLYSLPVLKSTLPADVSVSYNYGSNTTATFKVEIETDGKPAEYTYQWYDDNGAISGATGASYSRTVTTEDGANIYCRVYNKAGYVQSRTAKLTATCNDLSLISTSPQPAITISGNGFSQQTEYVQLKTSLNVSCYIQTSMLDLTAFKTLTGVFDYWANSTNGFYWYIKNSSGTVVKSSSIGFGTQGTYTNKTHSIDVSGLTGKHYIEFRRDATSSGAYLGIKRLNLLT